MERMDEHLPEAAVIKDVAPARPGIVSKVDARSLGLAIINLGGGRRRVEDSIDYSVGLSNTAAIGESVGRYRPLCTVHAANNSNAERAAAAIRAAVTISDEKPPSNPLVRQRVGPAPS